MTFLSLAIFLLTYGLIAVRRLRLLPIGRPAGALLGATLMVGLGVLSPEESYRAIDHDTIVLLFGMMLLSAELSQTGFFAWTSRAVLRVCRTPLQLLLSLALLSGVLSAFLVNDTVCLFLAPVVVSACQRAKLPMGPYLIALATSANIGSAATLVGNPQNMIIGSLSGISFRSFLFWVGPVAAVGLLVNGALLYLFYRREIGTRFMLDGEGLLTEQPVDGPWLFRVMLVVAGVVVAFFAGAHLGYATLFGATLVMLWRRREPSETFGQVDWTLLVFFSGLFVVVAGLSSTGLIQRAWEALAPHLSLTRAGGVFGFSGAMVIGSNLVSNVPMVLLTGPHLGALGSETLGWLLLSFTTTIAGNLTLVGSVANIIVAERARDSYELGFLEYLRFGVVSTLAVLLVGVPLLVLLAG